MTTTLSGHPDLYSNWRVAKRAAAVLARCVGARLIQTPVGKPRVLMAGGMVRDFATWLSAWSWLSAVRTDQVARARQ